MVLKLNPIKGRQAFRQQRSENVRNMGTCKLVIRPPFCSLSNCAESTRFWNTRTVSLNVLPAGCTSGIDKRDLQRAERLM